MVEGHLECFVFLGNVQCGQCYMASKNVPGPLMLSAGNQALLFDYVIVIKIDSGT